MTRRGLVLDVETTPDRRLLSACGLGARVAENRIWLHRLAAFAALQFEEADDGAVSGFRLTSVEAAPAGLEAAWRAGVPDEIAALGQIEALLAELQNENVLVTFNGRRHDVPFLLTRRRANALPARSHLTDYAERGGGRHCDVMEWLAKVPAGWGRSATGKGPSLDRACRQLAIPHEPHSPRAPSPFPATIRKSETDVLATFLLFLLQRSGGKLEAARFRAGWAALAGFCLQTPACAHRTQFAFAPQARAALRWAAAAPAIRGPG